jgi:hypothetical protein
VGSPNEAWNFGKIGLVDKCFSWNLPPKVIFLYSRRPTPSILSILSSLRIS